MIPRDWVRKWALFLEIRCIQYSSFLEKIPVFRKLHRNITADVEILSWRRDSLAEICVRFRTPYLGLPVAIEKIQIGFNDEDRRFYPSAFRFFDWHSWKHISGEMEWIGEHRVVVKGRSVEFITGFIYRAEDPSAPTEHFGLRLAEGVEGVARVLCCRDINRMKF